MRHDGPPQSIPLGCPHYGPADGDEEQDGEKRPQDSLQYEGLLHPRPGATLDFGQGRRVDKEAGTG